MSNVTPMMQQYLKIKSEYQDCLLFFRLGDFYEMFYEDAKEASRVLVPYHSADSYIDTLVNNGYKVAICEQMEDPKQTKGMVRREVVRIVTPGTVMEQGGVDDKQNNYILSFVMNQPEIALSYCDVSTGELKVTHFNDEATLLNEITTINPNEVVINDNISDNLKRQINMVTETITVRETLSSEIYSVNQTEHKLMYQATQLLLDYIHHTSELDFLF